MKSLSVKKKYFSVKSSVCVSLSVKIIHLKVKQDLSVNAQLDALSFTPCKNAGPGEVSRAKSPGWFWDPKILIFCAQGSFNTHQSLP